MERSNRDPKSGNRFSDRSSDGKAESRSEKREPVFGQIERQKR